MENADVQLLTFSEVLVGLKEGKQYARKGWNGKDLSVRLTTDNGIVVCGCVLRSFFMLFNRNDMSANTWVPSVSDLLAEDWYEVF